MRWLWIIYIVLSLYSGLKILQISSFLMILNIDPNTPPSPQLSDSFNHLLTDFGLSQVVSEPTRTSGRSSSTIDLAVVSNMNSFLSCEVLAPLANSDHKTVVLTLSSPSSHKHFPQPRKTVWIYKKADIQLAKRLLRDLPMASTSGSIGRNGLNPSWQPSGNPFRPSWYQSNQAPLGLIGKFARTSRSVNCFTSAIRKATPKTGSVNSKP